MSEDLEQVYCYLLNCFYAESDFSLIYHLQKLKGTEEYMTFFPCQTIISIKFYTKAENLGDGLISQTWMCQLKLSRNILVIVHSMELEPMHAWLYQLFERSNIHCKLGHFLRNLFLYFLLSTSRTLRVIGIRRALFFHACFSLFICILIGKNAFQRSTCDGIFWSVT